MTEKKQFCYCVQLVSSLLEENSVDEHPGLDALIQAAAVDRVVYCRQIQARSVMYKFYVVFPRGESYSKVDCDTSY